MKSSSLALGIYQNLVTAEEVLAELHRKGVWRVAAIYHRSDGNLVVRSSPFTPGFLTLLLLTLSVGAGLFWFFGESFAFFGVLALAFLLTALMLRYRFTSVDKEVIARYENAVLDDEVLVIAQIRSSAVRNVLGILREVKAGHPVSFLLRGAVPGSGQDRPDEKLSGEPFTLEGTEAVAAQAATLMPPAVTSRHRVSRHFAQRLKKIQQTLHHLRDDISDA